MFLQRIASINQYHSRVNFIQLFYAQREKGRERGTRDKGIEREIKLLFNSYDKVIIFLSTFRCCGIVGVIMLDCLQRILIDTNQEREGERSTPSPLPPFWQSHYLLAIVLVT